VNRSGERSAFGVRWRSTFDVRRSMFDVRRSSFVVRRSSFGIFDGRRSVVGGRRSTSLGSVPCGWVRVGLVRSFVRSFVWLCCVVGGVSVGGAVLFFVRAVYGSIVNVQSNRGLGRAQRCAPLCPTRSFVCQPVRPFVVRGVAEAGARALLLILREKLES